MLKLLKRIFFLFLFLSSSFSLSAAETVLPAKSSAFDLYIKDWDKKFDKGAFNFVAGWTELVNQPLSRIKTAEAKNKTLEFTAGIGQGLVFSVTDTLGGFLNALTSPVTQFEIPLPRGGVQEQDVTGGKSVGSDSSLKTEDSELKL